jgi:hypothetical protein
MKFVLDRITARAMVEAGYMPLTRYIEMFGESTSERSLIPSPDIAPDSKQANDTAKSELPFSN